MKKTHLIILIACICTAVGLGIMLGSGVLGGKKAKTGGEKETPAVDEKPTEVAKLTPSEDPSPSVTPVPSEEPTAVPTPEPTEEPTETPTPEPTEAPTQEPVKTYAVKRVVKAESPYGSVVCNFDPENGSLTNKVCIGNIYYSFPEITDYTTKETYEYLDGIRIFIERHWNYDSNGNETSSGMTRMGDAINGSLETGYDGILTACYYYLRPTSLDFDLCGIEWGEEYDDQGRVTAMFFLKADDRFSRIEYDGAGNVSKRTDYDSYGNELRRCEFMYNDAGQLISARNANAGEQDIYYVMYQYDRNGILQTGTFYRKGGKVAVEKRFIYDEDGDVIEIRMSYEGKNEEKVLVFEYETMNVEVNYLTNQERKEAGLSYDPEWVFKQTFVIDPYLWQAFSDIGSVY